MERYSDRKLITSTYISQIYSATDKKTNSLVALKVVDEDLQVKPHNVKVEIKFLKKHRDTAKEFNYLEYIDSFTKFDDIILVTTLYDFDLRTLMKKYQRKSTKFNWADPSKNQMVYKNEFPIDLGISIFKSIAKTLTFLHEKLNIIHRDIKPENIFFKEGNSLEPILGDFGTIYDKNLKDNDNNEPIENKITDVCTGIYKPPELCLGLFNYDNKIDIWSLGVIMNQIFSSTGESCLNEAINTSDIALIDAIFKNFGTPSTTKTEKHELYWPEMKGKSNFEAFNFVEHYRKDPLQLIPRAPTHIQNIWNKMMIYQSDFRASAHEIYQALQT